MCRLIVVKPNYPGCDPPILELSLASVAPNYAGRGLSQEKLAELAESTATTSAASNVCSATSA